MTTAMTNLEKQIAAWHEKRFGPRVDVPATYRKLLEEVGELGQALINQDQRAVREEAGDVALVLSHIVRGGCPAWPSLTRAIEAAHRKCEERFARGDELTPSGKHRKGTRK